MPPPGSAGLYDGQPAGVASDMTSLKRPRPVDDATYPSREQNLKVPKLCFNKSPRFDPSFQSSGNALPGDEGTSFNLSDSEYSGVFSASSSIPSTPTTSITSATKSTESPNTHSPGLVCIGSVYADAVSSSSSFENGKASKKIVMQPNGNSLQLFSSTKASKYAGILKQPASGYLRSLISEYKLEIDAFVPELTAIPKDRRQQGLQVVLDIFCPPDRQKKVGRALAANGIYLQEPFKNSRRLNYMNPHLFGLSKAAQELLAQEGFDITNRDENSQKKAGILGVKELVHRNNEIADIFTQSSDPLAKGLSSSNLAISPRISTQLKIHQLSGVQWMFERENGAGISSARESIHGGILADDMGMGKTLTTLALIATSNDMESLCQAPRTTLLICPKSVIASWREQLEQHTQLLSLVVDPNDRRLNMSDINNYDLLITTYGVVASGSYIATAIRKHHWRRIVLDEAHVIRERNTNQAKRIFSLNADYRWCLTGTPVQNKLDDYGSLLQFLKHPYYGTREKFNKEIIKPLRCRGPFALQKLKHLISETTIRRLKSGTSLGLQDPQNVDQKLTLHPDEKRLHDLLHEFTANQREEALCRGVEETGTYKAQLILRLRQVCNHGIDLLPLQLQDELRRLEIFGMEGDSTSAISVALNHMICELCKESKSDHAAGLISFTDCQHVICAACKVEDGDCPICIQANQEEVSAFIKPSTKVLALIQNLRTETHLKSVVFSCWTKMLDLVEIALRREGIEFIRIDGSLSLSDRQDRINYFRNSGSCMTLLLILGTGSVGLDLTAASRVHLLEPQFNPMLEEQALARVHRIGQTQPVTTIRYIISGSYEEQILERQNKKLQLAELCVSGSIKNKKVAIEDLEDLDVVMK
ncbi:hypothetical protein AA313_de0208672 [Arthrobotrys entomopaga]|nr:hypothetical protein AA313_de0208672 [Arthrobotrys entomopaga]